MRIVESKYFPPGKRTVAINILGVLFLKKGHRDYFFSAPANMNHEKIHTAQIKEMLYVFFYVWYVIEYLFRLCYYFSPDKAYINLSLEREAYSNEGNPDYLKRRNFWAFIKYL